MTVGRLIKAGLTGVTVFLWILMAGLLTGCGSRNGEIAEETVQDENIETEADIFYRKQQRRFHLQQHPLQQRRRLCWQRPFRPCRRMPC